MFPDQSTRPRSVLHADRARPPGRGARVLVGLACGVVSACGLAATSETASSSESQRRSLATQAEPAQTAPPPPEEAPDAGAADPAAGRFSVHEWGLVATGARAGFAVGTTSAVGSPPRTNGMPPRRPPPVDHGQLAPAKPVFYVHLDDGLDELRFSLGVRSVSRGRVVEHYPPAVRYERNTALTWDNVVARRGSCRGRYPLPTDALCETRDGVCELAELSAYETEEAACLQAGAVSGGLLFYRMAGARDTLPLDVRPHPDGSVLLRSVAAPPGGLILRVHRAASFGATRVRRVELDALGRATVPPREVASGLAPADAGLGWLSAALDEAGLTAQERDAFLRAWRVGLFGASPGDPVGAAVVPNAHPLAPVADALLYFWPREEVDAALPLTISPEPREVRRVFVVRVDLAGDRGPSPSDP